MKASLIPLSALASLALAAPLTERAQKAALYFLNNDPSGNSLISMPIHHDGKLGGPKSFHTGGNGGIATNNTLNIPSDEGPAMVDVLYSQGSVCSVDNLVFAVNAGSNTLSVFEIDPQNPSEITLVGHPIDTLGTFPNTVTYSSVHQLACVANTGATNGVACFKYVPGKGLEHSTKLLVPGVVNQTDPPVGPEFTYSEILWNPTSEFMVATVKGSGNYKTQSVVSPIIYFPFDASTGTFGTPVTTTFPDVFEAFGFVFTGDNTIWMVDPNFGGSIVSFASDGTATQELHDIITDQFQTCWSNWDPKLERLYGFPGGQDQISMLTLEGEFLGNVTNGSPGGRSGTYDNAIYNSVLYTLVAGANGVSVVDLAQNKSMQFLDTTVIAPNRQYYEGMTFYPNQ